MTQARELNGRRLLDGFLRMEGPDPVQWNSIGRHLLRWTKQEASQKACGARTVEQNELTRHLVYQGSRIWNRWSVEGIFGQRRQFIEEKRIMQEEIKRGDRLNLVVLRWDPNAMDIDMMKRQGMCFNCGVKGHIAARCPEPRKERKFFGRRTKLERSRKETLKEDFGKGRE